MDCRVKPGNDRNRVKPGNDRNRVKPGNDRKKRPGMTGNGAGQ
jgi:hypothetical protein